MLPALVTLSIKMNACYLRYHEWRVIRGIAKLIETIPAVLMALAGYSHTNFTNLH
jgi:hypothetical protein